jgi:putative DNA primase/helicase
MTANPTSNVHILFDHMMKAGPIPNGGHLHDIPRPSDYTDEALALRFTDRHKDDLRFINTWGRWMVWNGERWQTDETLKIVDLTRKLARDSSAEIVDRKGSQKLTSIVASAKTISAIERLARADRQHASRTDDWDSDPWLLNTPTGTIDLKTGNLRPHERRDHITKITEVGPGGDCPIWLGFLREIFNGDEELVAFVQRVLGYALTGLTREHALFFLYGTGGNGKGVFLNTFHGILGDYSTIAPMETFTVSNNERHPTELAMLRGARLVAAQETEDGQRWAEAKIKALTGGDPISARFMRQDFFTFVPLFKLLIAGNTKPSLRNVDDAIRRRFNLIPFVVTIPPDKRDPDLAEKLKAEWSGILAWAVEGCLEWQRIGLSPPPAVLNATQDYLAGEDAIGRFIAECCELEPGADEELKALYAAWEPYRTRSGEPAISEKAFGQRLEGQKLQKGQDSRTRRVCFKGIRLRRQEFDGGLSCIERDGP